MLNSPDSHEETIKYCQQRKIQPVGTDSTYLATLPYTCVSVFSTDWGYCIYHDGILCVWSDCVRTIYGMIVLFTHAKRYIDHCKSFSAPFSRLSLGMRTSSRSRCTRREYAYSERQYVNGDIYASHRAPGMGRLRGKTEERPYYDAILIFV